MYDQFELVQKRTFKTFLNFSFLILLLILIFFTILSTKYRVTNYEINRIESSSVVLNLGSLESIKGESIWLVNESDFEKAIKENNTIENIIFTKNLPNSLLIEIKEFESIAKIIDFRNSIPKNTILFKNQLEVENSSNDYQLPLVTITNGPVAGNFSGELVSFFVTLKKYNLNISDFSLVHNGSNLVGEFRGLSIYFGQPIDLGTKASVIGDFLSNKSCSGEIRFLTSEEIVSNC